METLFKFLMSIRWQDIIDVFLNSYVLFRLYALFRGTAVFRILLAIAFLWFFQRIAAYLDLILTGWVFQGIMAAAVFLIIVLFRNEIRSVLQTRNIKSILWGFPRPAADTPVDIIVESVYEMAGTRTGALLVFPGKEDLEEYIHSGMSWQGLVSREMILSIFWPDNPVHDGAAVVQGDRIMEVGALLPVSSRKGLPTHFGTRHRAAAGLAESTDAMVIVVSEERGNVVVAKGNHVRTVGGKGELNRIITEHLGVSKETPGYFKKRKIELALAATISFLFISGIWFSFTRGSETLITMDIPITYMNQDPSMLVLDTSNNTSRLHLTGSEAFIKSLKPEKIQIRINLEGAEAGLNTYTIREADIRMPSGISLKEIKPKNVEVYLDLVKKKRVPIQIDWIGRLGENLILTGAKVEPEFIEISGGSKIVEEIDTIYTKKISLQDISESGKKVIQLALNPESLAVDPNFNGNATVIYSINKRNK